MHACFCVGFAVGCLVSVASCHFCPVAWTRVAVMASDVYIEPNTLLLSRTRVLRANTSRGVTHGGGLCSRGVDRGPVRAPSEWLISRCALSERGRSLGASITCLRRACACSPVPSFQRRKSYASRCACTNLCRGEDLRRVAHHGAGARWQAFNEWRCAPRQRPARHTIPAAAQTHALLRIRCCGC